MLRRRFLKFATVYLYFNVQMRSYFIFGNKVFCFFKKWVFAFSGEDIFQGEKTSSPKFRGGC